MIKQVFLNLLKSSVTSTKHTVRKQAENWIVRMLDSAKSWKVLFTFTTNTITGKFRPETQTITSVLCKAVISLTRL